MTAATFAPLSPNANADLSRIPILFNIHVEPDLRIIDYEKRRWLGYEDLHAFLFNIRPALEKATGRPVYFNWFFRLDWQIEKVYGDAAWALKQYGSLIKEAKEYGDSLGLHIHAWRPKRIGLQRTWLADFSDQKWISSCISLAHHTFFESLQEQPHLFSFGGHYLSLEVLAQLESLGFRCDLTMYPGRPLSQHFVPGEETCGWLPSFLNTPRHAFKPSRQEFSKPGSDSMNLWEIPVSVGFLKSAHNPQISEVHKFLLGMPLHQAREIIEQNLALPNPYLLAEIRSDVRLDTYNQIQFDKTLEHMMHHPLAKTMEFNTVSAYLDQLELATQ